MDWKLITRVSQFYQSVADSDWLKRASARIDRMIAALTSLELPRDANKPQIVELERRILYSASPMPTLDAGSAEGNLSQFECPSHMDPTDWDSFLLEIAPSMEDGALNKIVDEIKIDRDTFSDIAALESSNLAANAEREPDLGLGGDGPDQSLEFTTPPKIQSTLWRLS